MANQPKKYKKFVATAATATLVASAIVPVASAASFKDISKLDQQTQDAIVSLSEAGVIKGYADGTFKPNQTLTRGQVAKLLGRWLEANGTQAPANWNTVAAFSDVSVSGDQELAKYAALVKEAGVFTGSNGKLNPSGNITRQQISKVLNNAYGKVNGKTLVELAENIDDVNVQDLASAQAEFQPFIQALGDLKITTVANFNPNGSVTRGQFAKFLNITANTTGEGTTTPVDPVNPSVPAGDFSVVALDDANSVLSVTFNQPVSKLEASDFIIKDAKTGETYGVKTVSLSSNGKVATLQLYAPDNAGRNNVVLKYTTDYTVTLNGAGKTSSATFNRLAFAEQRVTAVDVAERKITLTGEKSGEPTLGAVEVLDNVDINFEDAKGRTIKVWYNKDNDIVKYEFDTTETVVYSPVQLDKAFAGVLEEGRIVTLVDGKKLELSDKLESDLTANNNKVFKFTVNDTVQDFDTYRAANLIADPATGAKTKDPELDWAKVVVAKNGEVEYIAGYNFEAYSVVKNVDVTGKEVVGQTGTSSIGKADKYLVIKDNKVISYKDLQPNDVVLYQQKAYGGDGIAVVVNNTVKGSIESVNEETVVVAGKELRFKRDAYYAGNMPNAKFVDEDGDYVSATTDDLEDLQRGGEVTAYLDAKGDLLFVTGQQVEGSKNVAVLTDNAQTDTAFGKDSIQLEVLGADKTEKIYKVQLDTLKKITLNGVKYDIDTKANLGAGEYTPTIANGNLVLTPFGGGAATNVALATISKGKLVEFGFNKNGALDELKLYQGVNGKEDISVIDTTVNQNQLLESGDSYAVTNTGAKKLSDRVVVFDVTKGANVSYDAKDITVTNWKDYNGSDISKANVLYDDKGEVVAIVIEKKVSTDVVFEEAVITKVTRNVDGELTAISAYVNGKKVDLSADKLDDADAKALGKGDVALLEFDKGNNTLVKDVTRNGRVAAASVSVTKVDTGEREVTFSNGVTYKLANDGVVLNGMNNDDIVVESFSYLVGKNNVTVVLDEVNGTFAKYFVVEPQGVVGAPAAVTNVAFVDTDADAGQIGGIVTFTGSATAGATAKVFVNGVEAVGGVVAQNTASNVAITIVVTGTDGKQTTTVVNAVDVTGAVNIFGALAGKTVVNNGLGEYVVSVPKASVSGTAPYTITVKGKTYTFAPNVLDANVLTTTIPTTDATQAEVEAGVVNSTTVAPAPTVAFSTLTGAKVASNGLGEYIVSAPKASFGAGTTFSITVKGTKYNFAPNILDANILTVSIPTTVGTQAEVEAGTVSAN